MARVPLEQPSYWPRRERKDISVGLGALERALDARLGRLRVAERVAGECVEEERLDSGKFNQALGGLLLAEAEGKGVEIKAAAG
jgi:hypothetical protein